MQKPQNVFTPVSEPMERLPSTPPTSNVQSASDIPDLKRSTDVLIAEKALAMFRNVMRQSSTQSPPAEPTIVSTDTKATVVTSSPPAASPPLTLSVTSQSSNARLKPSQSSLASPPPPIKPCFVKLMQILDESVTMKIPRPLRRAVASRLMKESKDAYISAGVNGWKEYAALAEKIGLVKLGIERGNNGWITLHPNWLGKVPKA